MTKPVTLSVVFANLPGPIPLSDLDTDFSPLYSAVNDLGTYGNYLVDSSGAANAIVVTTNPSLTYSQTAGVAIQVQIAHTTTSTAVNINVNGTGNVAVLNADGSLPVAGQFITGEILPMQFDGVSYRVLNPQSPNVGTGLFPNGTVGAPAIAFTNSTGTGFYRVGADILGIATAGVQRAQVNATGNWVFDAPSAGIAITVTGLAAATSVVTINQAGANRGLQILPSASSQVAIDIIDPGTNATEIRIETTNTLARFIALGTSTGLTLENTFGVVLTANATGTVTLASGLGINNNAPPAQVTGWGTPTGPAVVNNFSGGAATLVNCSNAIAEIIVALKAFGLFGA